MARGELDDPALFRKENGIVRDDQGFGALARHGGEGAADLVGSAGFHRKEFYPQG